MRRLRSAGLGKSGASAAEYALILAVMGGGLVVAVLALTGSVNTAMNSVGTVLSSGT
jgi:pilus assembly protein Flp/PilA